MIAAPSAVPFWSPDEIEASLRRTLEHLESGGVLAYPTETVYGFGTAVDHDAVATLVRMKRRPPGEAVPAAHLRERRCSSASACTCRASAARLAARHWPGPLTLVLPGGERRVPLRLRGPEGGIAVRWTPHVGLTRLIARYGDPITSTSANRPGVPPAMSASEIVEQWPDDIDRGHLARARWRSHPSRRHRPRSSIARGARRASSGPARSRPRCSARALRISSETA